MAVDDRVRGLLKSESSQKGKGESKGKGKTKRLTPRSCTAFTKITMDQVMLQKKRQIPSGSWGKIKHVERVKQRIQIVERKGHRQRKEVGPREGQDPTTNVERQGQRKELWKGQASEKSARRRKGERAEAKTRKVSQVENPTKIGKVYVETIPVTHTYVVSRIWWV